MKPALSSALVCLLLLQSVSACELCAIYSASNARGESTAGFQFSVSEQFTASEKLLFEGKSFPDIPFFKGIYWNDSITHLVPAYNFSPRFGVSVNLPIIYREFDRYEQRYEDSVIRIRHERGSESGLGDAALIGRWTVIQKAEMKYSIFVNLLAGVKFPTGDADRLKDDVEQARLATRLLGPDHRHDVLPIHQSDLSLGSASFDGVFGTAVNLRWDRWFFDNQIQYYLRTEAEGYKFGDEFIISGGPGAYLLLGKSYTLSLQAKAFYETTARDEVLGLKSNTSGLSSWWVGPLLGFTWGDRLSANVGVDTPWHIYNHGLQIVPDYRVHGGFTWRF